MAMPDFELDDVELRCQGGLHGIMKGGLLEVRCRHWACTRGGVAYHLIDLYTGEVVETYRYKDPNKETK
jgi:hypothetical protein